MRSTLTRVTRRTPVAASLVAAILAMAAPAAAVTRHVFVTSGKGTGNFDSWPGGYGGGLSGIAAANAICQSYAFLSSNQAISSNYATFRAWISVTGTDAYCNVLGYSGTKGANCGQGGTLPQAGPWRLANGVTAFGETLDEIVNGDPHVYFPAFLDEDGASVTDVTDAQYWSATGADGKGGYVRCNDWSTLSSGVSGSVGTGLGTSVLWTVYKSATCNESHRLLCMQMGAGDATANRWSSPGSIVFVTSDQHPSRLGDDAAANGQTGVAAGDQICRARATAGHLPQPQSFVAWLSDSNSEVATRITSNGPFRRIDGIAVANSKADFMDGSIATSIHQTELGTYLDTAPYFASGTDAFGNSTGSDCSDWTSTAVTSKGVGTAAFARTAEWADAGTAYSCVYPERLVCVSNKVTVFWDGFDYTGSTARWSAHVP